MARRPDFIIIGAMKCATSTLHTQLARQPGFVMSEPKEPYFFSNDEVYDRGIGWYESLFAAAGPGDLCGESSTHYTKLPTYPRTIERMRQHVPNARLIYVMRHPVDRLVSQYIHEWTQRVIECPIDEAVDRHPELIAYSRYTMQLEPFFESYGRDRVLPVFFDRVRDQPQAELERIARFIGYDRPVRWDDAQAQENASNQRMRKSPLRDALVNLPGVAQVRRGLIPQGVRDRVKQLWMMKQRPQLSEVRRQELVALFDEDLAKLGDWLGVSLSCENFKAVTAARPLGWARPEARASA